MNLQGCRMTEKDWEEVDRTSRGRAAAFFKRYYQERGCDVEIRFTKGDICYDVLVVVRKPDGTVKRAAVECKDRASYVKQFKDVMIEEIKYASILARMKAGEFDRAFAVNTYDDGEIWLAKVESPYFQKKTLPCPATSKVKGASQDVEWKPCVLFKKYCGVKG